MDDIIDKDDIADGFTIKDGGDEIDVVDAVDTEEVLDDPNTELYDKAFPKEDEGVINDEDPDALEMSAHIFEELGYEDR
jgi:hypothetical protein